MSVGDAWGLIICFSVAFWIIGAYMGLLTEKGKHRDCNCNCG